VDTGSRKENASNKEVGLRPDPIGTEMARSGLNNGCNDAVRRPHREVTFDCV
jgi:hypothetical protein